MAFKIGNSSGGPVAPARPPQTATTPPRPGFSPPRTPVGAPPRPSAPPRASVAPVAARPLSTPHAAAQKRHGWSAPPPRGSSYEVYIQWACDQHLFYEDAERLALDIITGKIKIEDEATAVAPGPR
jgi:hypothetical protein